MTDLDAIRARDRRGDLEIGHACTDRRDLLAEVHRLTVERDALLAVEKAARAACDAAQKGYLRAFSWDDLYIEIAELDALRAGWR